MTVPRQFTVRIAEHLICFRTDSPDLFLLLQSKYGNVRVRTPDHPLPDLTIDLQGGYGRPFVDYAVKISAGGGSVRYERADYLIETDADYRHARIKVHDGFALKHAMINLYSSFITHRGWGVLLHSSCAIERGRAYLFAGRSGAGKSTVARLSAPREIFSDEASILKISEGEIAVFNSPFRSDTEIPYSGGRYPLAGIYLLQQALEDRQIRLSEARGLTQVLGKVFCWARHPEETGKVWEMCRTLVMRVPAYQLHFRRQASFWNEILVEA